MAYMKFVEEWNQNRTPDIEGVYFEYDTRCVVIGIKIPIELIEDFNVEQNRITLFGILSRAFGWLEATVKRQKTTS